MMETTRSCRQEAKNFAEESRQCTYARIDNRAGSYPLPFEVSLVSFPCAPKSIVILVDRIMDRGQ